jgi:hypothetical protein
VNGWVGNDRDLAERFISKVNRQIQRQGYAFLPQTN